VGRNVSRAEAAAVSLLLILFVVLATAYAVRTAPWQAPDEPAHYNYIAQVAQNGCCPLIEPGDWDSALLEQLKAARFAPDLLGPLPSIQYEDHQPPLYYLVLSPVYALTGGSLLALRVASALIAALALLASYLAARTLLGGDRWPVAWGAAALIALIPQHLAIIASVNNDSLAELLIALTLWQSLRLVRGDRVPPWALGVLVGFGFLVKASTFLMAGVAAAALICRWWMLRRTQSVTWRALSGSFAAFLVPALALGALWWLRNIGVYGFPDIFGLRQHDAVVVGQTRTAEVLAQVGFGPYLASVLQTTFNSFWGQFGWMGFPLPAWSYALIGLLLGTAAAGWVVRLIRREPADPRHSWKRFGWLLVGLTAGLAVAQYLYYNLEFYQLQGRYLFPLLIPLGLFVAVGLDGWSRLWIGRWPRVRWLAQMPIVVVLAPLNAWILWRVLPLLAP
jgi:4-amino-4-deoxy-L-arabinose transferase-like glycosyltransferase